MRTYAEYRPTVLDAAGLGLPDQQDWLVAPCGTNRDAGITTRSNWRVMLAELAKVDPEGNDHEEHSFGHWACGHFEIVIVRPGSKCAELCEGFESALSRYPILSESDHSDLEDQEIIEYWENARLKERVELCSENGVSIFAARPGRPCPENVYDHLRETL